MPVPACARAAQTIDTDYVLYTTEFLIKLSAYAQENAHAHASRIGNHAFSIMYQ